MSIVLTGQQQVEVPVNLVNDNIYENLESFTASLTGSLPSFVTLGPDAATANVADDDCKCVCSVYM